MNKILIISFISILIFSCYPKHDYRLDEVFYREFNNTIDHKIKGLKSIRKQLLAKSIKKIGSKLLYYSIYDSLNNRTYYWKKRAEIFYEHAQSNVFMDSLVLFNKENNIAVCILYDIKTKNKDFDNIKIKFDTDTYVRIYFKKNDSGWEVFNEELCEIPKLGYTNISHTPLQMKLIGIDYFFYSFIKLKDEYTDNPIFLEYIEKSFHPKNCSIYSN